MQVDGSDLVKIIAAIGSAGAGFGGAFAFAKPFAMRFFESYLERAKAREQDERDKSRAIVRIAESHERTVGVLENFAEWIARVDVRLERLERVHEISVTPSGVPPPPPPVAPRQRLTTDPGIASDQRAPSSAGSGSRAG